MDYQKEANESLQIEMKSLLTQTEITPAYEEKIQQLEEQLESLQPNSEQSAAIDRIAVYLREIEDNLDRKTTLLESVHISTGIVTTCSSPSEDVSVRGSTTNLDASILSPRTFNVTHLHWLNSSHLTENEILLIQRHFNLSYRI